MSDSRVSGSQAVMFACSGASNVGELGDRACRRVAAEGHVQMSCMVRLGVEAKPVVQAARQAPAVVVVDGCGESCGRKTVERIGLSNVRHVCVTDLGIEKREGAPVTEELVVNLADHLRSLLAEASLNP